MTAPTATQERAVARTSAVDPAISEAMGVYQRLNALRNAVAPDLNDAELQLFAMVAHRTGLDPFSRQIHAVKRQGKVTFQVGIDGFRSQAEETGEYVRQDEPAFGEWVEKPFPHPVSATVTIYRRRGNQVVSQSATARWDSYYPGEQQGFQWKRMPDVMLSKCAEALAFRKLFPRTLGDIYAPEEMAQADAAEVIVSTQPSARERLAQRRAEIEAATTHVEGEAPGGAAQDAAEVEAAAGTAPAAAPSDQQEPEAAVGSDQIGPSDGQAASGSRRGRKRDQRRTPAITDDVDLVKDLRDAAFLGDGTTPATAEQREALRSLFSGMAPTYIRNVMAEALAVDGPTTLTSGDAQAILDTAVRIGKTSFLRLWTEKGVALDNAQRSQG